MAIVQLHPMFISLKGNLGGVIHVNRDGRQYVRRHVIPHNPDTAQQRHCRTSFADAVAAWQQLAPYKQHQWNAKACLEKRKGYNMFIAEYLREKYTTAEHGIDRATGSNISWPYSNYSFIIHNSSSTKQQLRCRSDEPSVDTIWTGYTAYSPG